MISDYENIVWYSFCVSGKHKQNHRTIFQIIKCTIQTKENKREQNKCHITKTKYYKYFIIRQK